MGFDPGFERPTCLATVCLCMYVYIYIYISVFVGLLKQIRCRACSVMDNVLDGDIFASNYAV